MRNWHSVKRIRALVRNAYVPDGDGEHSATNCIHISVGHRSDAIEANTCDEHHLLLVMCVVLVNTLFHLAIRDTLANVFACDTGDIIVYIFYANSIMLLFRCHKVLPLGPRIAPTEARRFG